MSYILTRDAIYAPGIRGNTKLVLIALANFANDKTGECYPSQNTIARVVGCDRTTVVGALNRLEEIGYIKRGNKHVSSLEYELTFPKVATAMCGNNSQIAGNGVLGKPTGVLGKPTGGVGKTNTNRDNRVENKEEKIESTQDKTIDFTARINNGTVGVCGSSSSFLRRDIKEDAVALLSTRGMTEKEARERIASVWEGFVEEAEKKDRSTLTNPRKYYAGWLANMARERGGEHTAEAEPTTLEGILETLVPYFKGIYHQQAHHIPEIVSVDGLPSKTIDYIRGLEAANWAGINDPIAKVREMIRSVVQRQIVLVKEEDRGSKLNTLALARRRLAEQSAVLMEYKSNDYPQAAIDKQSVRVAKLEERVAKVKEELAALEVT